MPLPPLHLGIPGILSDRFPEKVNLSSVVLGSLVIDFDFLLFLIGFGSIHGYFHTFLGASGLALLSAFGLWFSDIPTRLESRIEWDYGFSFSSLLVGSLAGTYTHVLLDSFIYRNISPFHPLSRNPLFLGRWMLGPIYFLTLVATLLFLYLYVRKVTT